MNRQLKKEPGKNIDENLNIIKKDILEKRNYIKKNPAFTRIVRARQMKQYDHHFDRNFQVNNNCNGCKVCEKVCPVDNIKVDEKPAFKDNCEHCLACIHNCPQTAISLKKEKSSARFRNQHVTLKEIINANN